MNLGILISISKYNHLINLPGCSNDAKAIEKILKTSKYDDILIIKDDMVKTSSIKNLLVDFINKYKDQDQNIDEVFFYYTGHGYFDGKDFYYLLPDFDKSKKRRSALENSELDNLLRALKPQLAIKVIDACQSGISYIKNSDEFSSYLKTIENYFEKCYFFFSSKTNQSSFANEKISYFTENFIKSIIDHTNEKVRYKEVIDYISDQFSDNDTQKPFFISQADFTEEFCIATIELKNDLEKFLKSIYKANKDSINKDSLLELVKKDSKKYLSEEKAFSILENISKHIENFKYPQTTYELYNISTNICNDYENLPSLKKVANWFANNEHNYFVEPIYEKEKVIEKVLKPRNLNSSMYLYSMIAGGIESGLYGSDYQNVEKWISVPVNIKLTNEIPFKTIFIEAKPLFPNLNKTAYTFIPILSKTHVRFFETFISYKDIGWHEVSLQNDSLNWVTKEFLLINESDIIEHVSKSLHSFWDCTISPIQKKLSFIEDIHNEEKP